MIINSSNANKDYVDREKRMMVTCERIFLGSIYFKMCHCHDKSCFCSRWSQKIGTINWASDVQFKKVDVFILL